MKPGSAGPGVPGIYPVIYDEKGKEMDGRDRQGREHLHHEPVARDLPDDLGRPRPLRPAVLREVLQEPQEQGLARLAVLRGRRRLLASDGYFRILGRVDDVINVAGHRLGTKELESACLTVNEVAEAAVVPVVDEVKGRVPEIYIALKPGYAPTQGDQGQGRRDHRDDDRQDRPPEGRSTSSRTCRRPGRGRSCAASWRPSRTRWTPVTSRRSRTPTSSSRSAWPCRARRREATKEGPEDLKQFGKEE